MQGFGFDEGSQEDAAVPDDVQRNVLERIETYRTADGGYHTVQFTLYGVVFALV